MGVRQAFLVFSVLLVLLIFGCGQKMVCEKPNVMIGSSCCLDANKNDMCDTRELPVTVEGQEELEQEVVEEKQLVEAGKYDDFAATFASTWDKKSYNALSRMFVKDLRLKFSSNEFNFLSRKTDTQLGITGVSLKNVGSNSAEYLVDIGSEKVVVSADIEEEAGVPKHVAFYFFRELDANTACVNDTECFFTFATISGDRNYCEKSGEQREDCLEKFGVSQSITFKIDQCTDIGEYYAMSDCLSQIAVNENDIEPCWHATYDKQIYECLGFVAAARDDVNECDIFVFAGGRTASRMQKSLCIMGYVKETSDTEACAKIDRRDDVMLGAMQENCYKLNFP